VWLCGIDDEHLVVIGSWYLEGLVGEADFTNQTVVEPLWTVGLFVDVLGCPQFGERLVSNGERADEVQEIGVSGMTSDCHPEDADRGACSIVPVWVNLRCVGVEKDLPCHVAFSGRQFGKVGYQGSCEIVPREDVATVVHDHRGRVVNAGNGVAQR